MAVIEYIRKGLRGDKYIWGAIFILIIISILSVYSSSSILAYKKDMFNSFYILRHSSMLLGGVLAIVLISHIPTGIFRTLAAAGLCLGIAGVASALLFGSSINGSSRWLNLFGIMFQPSEVAKLALLIYTCKILEQYSQDLSKAFWMILLGVVFTCIPILLENLSTFLLVAGTTWIMMVIGRIPFKYTIGLLVVGASALTLLIVLATASSTVSEKFYRTATWKARIERYSNPSEDNNGNYQATQARMAVATGGIFGKGPGNSYMKNFLPMAFSDFIYAIILEEDGMIGGILIVICFIVILTRAYNIMRNCEQPFDCYLIIGIALMLSMQAIVNMAVNVGLFPVTGQTLPLVSMGGSSNIITGVALGIIQSIAANNAPKTKAKTEQVIADSKLESTINSEEELATIKI